MAQRRSKNRRLSKNRRSSNISGFLNDNTNITENNDPLWFDRSTVRPSTDFHVTRNASSILNADSTINASQLSDKWFNNLTRSDSSKLREDIARNNEELDNDEITDNNQLAISSESEGEKLSQKKRAKYRMQQKANDQSQNIFFHALQLEKTTDSHTRNLTTVQASEGNESETTDDTRTIQKLRSKFPKMQKHNKNQTSNFDKVLNSESVTEKIDTNNSRSLRSSKRKSDESNNQHTLTIETPQKLSKKHLKNAETSNISVGDKTNVKNLRNRSVVLPVSKANVSKKHGHADDSMNLSNSMAEPAKKKRSALFSQERKSTTDKNLFDDVFDSQEEELVHNHGNQIINETATQDLPLTNENNDEVDGNESESSSIPRNIRRTRSRSLFQNRNSEAEYADKDVSDDNNSESHDKKKPEENRKRSSQEVTKSTSLNNKSKSMSKSQNQSKNIELHKSLSQESTSIKKSNNLSTHNNEPSRKDGKNLSKSKIVEVLQQSLELEDSSDEENLFHHSSLTKQNTSKDEKLLNNSGKEKSNIASKSKISSKSVSIRSNRASQARDSASSDNDRNDQKKSEDERESSSTPEIPNKSRSHQFQRKKISERQHISKELSIHDESIKSNKSKKNSIQKSSKELSKSKTNQSLNISNHSVGLVKETTKNQRLDTSTANESMRQRNTKNNSHQIESDNETSTIPKYIRRTKSGIFPRFNNDEDDDRNAEIDVETVTHDVSQRDPSTSNALRNRSSNLNISAVRGEALMKSKPRILEDHILPKPISSDIHNISHKSNQKEIHSSQKSTNRSNTSDNIINSSAGQSKIVDVVGDASLPAESSVETSSDRTPEDMLPEENKDNRATPSDKLSVVSDDFLRTPHPAQSTLNLHGKRITQFQLQDTVIDIQRVPPATAPNENDESAVVDVVHGSTDEEGHFISRNPRDVPDESEQITVEDVEKDASPFLSNKPSQAASHAENNVTTIAASVWDVMKRKTDMMKKALQTRMQQEAEARRKAQLDKTRTDAKLKRVIALQEAEKRKKKKVVDKAYYVNGEVYKQPKLPRPRKWVTDRLYRYLWRCMEPKFGIRTRLRSEEFILQLTNVVAIVNRRQKYENYKSEVDDLLVEMAKLNLIKNRYDFYMFCKDFMPYSFREKVVPMTMPGNVRNIPYEPELVYKPIIKEGRARSSDSDSENRPEVQKGSESGDESESTSRSRSRSKSRSTSRSRSESRSRSKNTSRSKRGSASRNKNKKRITRRNKSKSRSRSSSNSRNSGSSRRKSGSESESE